MRMQNGAEHLVCDICLRTISHPICHECYVGHFGNWLSDSGFDSGEIKILSYKIKKSISETDKDIKCIICRAPGVSVCTYCLSFKMSQALTKISGGEKEDFVKILKSTMEAESMEANIPNFTLDDIQEMMSDDDYLELELEE